MRRVWLVVAVAVAACGDGRPQLAPRGYRLSITGEPDGFNVSERYFAFHLAREGTASGWGCLDARCFPNPRSNECVTAALTEDEHLELTEALNRADALERDDALGCVDSPSFRFQLEVHEPGGAGNEFELQHCAIDDPAIWDALDVAVDVIATCHAP